MRRGRVFTGALVAVIAAMCFAPAAPAGKGGGSSERIRKDLADGVLNGNYTKAELERYLKDSTLQGYPGTTTTSTTTTGTTATTGTTGTTGTTATTATTGTTGGTGGTTTGTTASPPPPATSGVAGTNTQGGGAGPLAVGPGRQGQPLTATQARGRLPFTGAQLGLFAIVGLALLAMGFLLRSTARQKPNA